MRTIIKHANRRLYDTGAGRTITLLELSEVVVAGEAVTVMDRATGEDITTVTLLQSLLERVKRRRSDESAAHDAVRIVAALERVISGEDGGEPHSGTVRESVSG